MGTTMRLKINNQGIRELFRSEGVKKDLKRRADAVAEAAKATTDMDIEVQDRTGVRARYRVIALDPRAKALEAEERILGRAIDAARD